MVLFEGGNAISTATPILSSRAAEIGRLIVNRLKQQLNVNACTLGSTGKKLDNELSGDIDIAVELSWNDENLHNIRQFIKSNFGSVIAYSSNGLRIYSFGYKYRDTDEIKTVQVDLMFTTDIRYSQFMYHSPNYRNGESAFKGLYRTNLLVIVANNMPVDKPTLQNVYFTKNDYDGSYDGELKSFWKYTLSYEEGLKIVHKSFVGKNRPLKNPQTIKNDTILITKDINKILTLVLGDDATINDSNSFESLVEYLCSHKSKLELDKIFDDFLNDERHKPMLKQCEKVITDTLKKYNKM